MEDFSPLTPEILVPKIGEYLVEKGLISSHDLHAALANQTEIKVKNGYHPLLGQILIDLEKISRQDLDQAITEQILQLRQALENSNQHLEQRVKARTIQLEEAMEKLSELSKEKANFVSNVSHELRTPLTHLIGYLDLLNNHDLGALTAAQEDALIIMQRATNRLEQLINDLIFFSSSEKGKLNLQISDFSIIHCCKKAVERSYPGAKEKNVSLEFTPSAEIIRVIGDEDKIFWVISHLIENAIKFTPTGGQISVRVENSGKDVAIIISDTGIGISEDKISEIFEPFHQLDGSTTRRYGGTGLGLSLAKKIIDAHGAVIQVTSSLDEGSKFEFVLKEAAIKGEREAA